MPSSSKGAAALSEVDTELNAMHAPFTVEKYISSGSYGAVCSGRDAKNRPVAIKRVYTTVSDGRTVTILSDSFLAKRVLREVKLLAHFSHPNILSLRHVILNMQPKGKEKLYLVTDLMKTDLAQVIADPAIPIPPGNIQHLMYHILLGLNALHEAGVVHRDLHPGNILLTEDCEVKICDFNLAREDTSGDDKTHYVTHRWYRAPELVMQFRHFTKKVDIWSAGCVMGELFNRKTLFRGSTFYNQLNKIIEVVGTPRDEDVAMFSSQSAREYLKATLSNFPARPWAQVCPTADPLALDLLSKMLVFNPQHRISADAALRHPYFADIFQESHLKEHLAEPFHFNEQMNAVSDMHVVFNDIAEQYARKAQQDAAEAAEAAATTGAVGSIEGNNNEEKATLGKGHMPRTGSFVSLDS